MIFLILDFKELHGSIYYQTNVKKKTNKVTDLDTIVTSNKVITLLGETRLDKMGVDDMSVRRNRIRQTGPNSFYALVLSIAQHQYARPGIK